MKKLLFLAGLLVIGLQMNADESPDILETFGSAEYLEQRHDLQNQISQFTNTDPITVPYGSRIQNHDQGKVQDQLYYLDRNEFNRIVNKSAQRVSQDSAQFTSSDGTKMIVTNPMANVYMENIELNMNGTQVASSTYTFAYQSKALMNSINVAHKNMLDHKTPFAPVHGGPKKIKSHISRKPIVSLAPAALTAAPK
ncbi:hypothetical protein [Candidatus Chromulinivorax destructor]|uniref:LPS export ABC transporter periplasmic protein LptC n=1 Tax=Candidatus Chromulinivorax destructor TaxID=2066483 RepID=A0A345ZD15_9BACT|nr:hypothetical protein [Candidatus Chromulinivorax destructor]AXK61182.1 hypothetical protein C0J27_05630 [Candidatus Chromulinivorax destructor]